VPGLKQKERSERNNKGSEKENKLCVARRIADLRQVEIHLIPVELRVVGRADAKRKVQVGVCRSNKVVSSTRQ
jgi:hypothetical protein